MTKPFKIIPFVIGLMIYTCTITYLNYTYFKGKTYQFSLSTTLKNYSYIAIIVELRSLPVTIAVIHNIISHIPYEWPILIFHSEQNLNFITNSTLQKYIQSHKISLRQLEKLSTNNTDDYRVWHRYWNTLFTSKTFWLNIPAEKILVFQTDTIMCSNSPHHIEDFLHYDYIGAPWHLKLNYPQLGGNGGFSLRSKIKTLELLEKLKYDYSLNEDGFYSQNLYLVNASLPTRDIAKTFSVETVFYPNPMAIHLEKGFDVNEAKLLCFNCPEIQMIALNKNYC
ncbi:unnamed protein product [Didymodactylos carnosus]|uniref:DUF5672 domain-containing protein n=1 Tax=Didymodactylos carnosus TaxID=1234261 RepID=A0A814JR22_9BILA|nr:unnamed protein product [Didymodactylos carnosus]CAF1099826.1 unnamed protein product [Didymodactylos carnosus]CAF3812732.1 unnamed protein product [Didymodactylos carnosus]CAF3861302.1 unnamed protein product [Didymodactylos carnosus]